MWFTVCFSILFDVEEWKIMGLYEKMFKVMEESEAIEKNMSVGFGSNSYKAISEASVLNAVKPLLKKHKLILFPIKIEAKDMVDTFTTAKGESVRLMTQVKATYKIVDAESGESEILETIGNGVDTQDKASGKAMTYAYKALLQKTFCLFSGEDTDNEHSDDITAKNTKVTGEYKSASSGEPKIIGEPEIINDKQSKLLFAKSKGYETQAKEILAKHGFTSSKQITKDKFNDILADLQKVINDGI